MATLANPVDLGPKVAYRTQITYNNTSANQNFTPAVTQQYDDELGMMRFVYDQTLGMQEYRFIQVAPNSAALGQGDICFFTPGNAISLTPTVNAPNGYAGELVSRSLSLTASVTAGDGSIASKNAVAGMANNTISVGFNGWVQTKGFVPGLIASGTGSTTANILVTSAAFTSGLNVTGVTTAVGDGLISSATAGQATNASVTLNTAATNQLLGYVFQANSAGNFCGARLCISW